MDLTAVSSAKISSAKIAGAKIASADPTSADLASADRSSVDHVSDNLISAKPADRFTGSLPATQLARANPRFTKVQVALGLLACTVIVRLITSGCVPLIPEEAYYWMYAQHPSLSYHDHPPMIAWVIRLGTAIFGQNEWGVRVVGNMMALASVGLMYCMARLWVNKIAAIIAAATLLVFPIYVWTGFIATMDSQLTFFWIVSLLGASIALRLEHRMAWLGWYLAGIGLGGAMLSKYTGIFVGAGIGLALLAHRPWRKHLLSPHPWIGGLLGLALFSPVVLWNYRNHWASFRYQFVDREEAHPFQSFSTVLSTANFFILQIAVVTPLLFALWIQRFRLRSHGWFARLRREPLVLFSTMTALPLLAAMAWKSILFDVHVDWTVTAYLSLLPLIGQTMAARWRMIHCHRRGSTASQARDQKIWDWSIVTTIGACLIGNMGSLFILIFLTSWTGHPGAFGPWQTLGGVVSRYASTLESETGQIPLVIGRGRYRLASELAFYRSPKNDRSDGVHYTTSEWFFGNVDGLAYADWGNDRSLWKGRDCVYVSDKDDIAKVVQSRFRQVTLVDDPALYRVIGGLTYHIAICRGFKG